MKEKESERTAISYKHQPPYVSVCVLCVCAFGFVCVCVYVCACVLRGGVGVRRVGGGMTPI